jgi:hypothetical protein
VRISVRDTNEKTINQISMALKPNEDWEWFKVRLANEFVDSRAIKKVNEVFLNQFVVNDKDVVPDLKAGKDFVLAVVTLGVLLYIYID